MTKGKNGPIHQTSMEILFNLLKGNTPVIVHTISISDGVAIECVL